MCKIISVCNQKGGIGKTNLTLNLGIGIANAGKKVLLIDSDPQGSLTNNLGFMAVELTNTLSTIYNKLIDPDFDEDVIPDDYILHSEEGVDLIPSNITLSESEFDLPRAELREYKLKNFISTIKDRYDYIFIDCPPSLGLLSVNALSASDEVLVPLTATKECLDMLYPFSKTYKRTRKILNPSLKINGFVFNLYQDNTNLTKEMTLKFKEELGADSKFYSPIPSSNPLRECADRGISIFKYKPRSKAQKAFDAYTKLVEEVLA